MTPNPPLALITGGSRGLGRSTALKLAEQGCDVIVTYLTHRAEAEEVVNLIRQAGRLAAALPLNAADSKTFDRFAADLREALQHTFKRDRFTYLVNNAGTGTDASFAETTEQQFDQLMNVHLKGVFFLTQKLLPLIADGGRIVNISSGLTRFCFPGKAAYGAMKGGVEVLSRYLAKELGPRGIAAPDPNLLEIEDGRMHLRLQARLDGRRAIEIHRRLVGLIVARLSRDAGRRGNSG